VSENAYAAPADTALNMTRITLLYLDEDPLQVVETIQAQERAWRTAGRSRDTSSVEDVRFASPFRAIVPWEWDWFDRA
jgi:hypothetical protein